MSHYKSHGEGKDWPTWNDTSVIESTVQIFNGDFIQIGSDSYIGHKTILKGYQPLGGKIQIGSRVWIGENCYLNGAGGIVIEDGVGIGPGVYILTSSHDFDMEVHEEVMRNPLSFAPVRICVGSDIGFGSKILPGVTIGRCAVIGAGSVVTEDIPPFAVAYGNPCKVARVRVSKFQPFTKP